MLTKTFSELAKMDIREHCDYRETKDDNGKKIQVPYLNWAKCKMLLHENGAETVYFEPLINKKTGSTLFMSDIPFGDPDKPNHCFEVRVKIVIDDKEYIQNYPLMNGVFVVRDETLNQLRLSNAQARAFVKGVAIHTGLGFNLWLNDENGGYSDEQEDLSVHKILKIKERVQKLITVKMMNGLSQDDIAEALGVTVDEFKSYMAYYNILNRLENAIKKL